MKREVLISRLDRAIVGCEHWYATQRYHKVLECYGKICVYEDLLEDFFDYNIADNDYYHRRINEVYELFKKIKCEIIK